MNVILTLTILATVILTLSDAKKKKHHHHAYRSAARQASEAPEEASEAPEGASEAPEGASDAPEGASDAPKGASDAPEGASDAPEGASDAPDEASEAPGGDHGGKAGDVGYVVGRCVDCANNKENYKDKTMASANKECIKKGKGLVCKNEGLNWDCADTPAKEKRQCHKSYAFEQWCNSKNPESPFCDGLLKYVPDGEQVGDGRLLGPNGTYIGPDGKYNWFD